MVSGGKVEHVLGDRIAASTDGEVRGLLLRLILCGAVASYLAYLAGGWLADAAGRRYSRVDPAAIPRAVSLAISVFVTLTGGPGALLIFLAAASIGILFLRIGLRPASLMAFLLVPSIHFFLGFRLPGLPPVRLETVAIHAIPGTTEALTAIVVAIGVGTCTYVWLARRGGP